MCGGGLLDGHYNFLPFDDKKFPFFSFVFKFHFFIEMIFKFGL